MSQPPCSQNSPPHPRSSDPRPPPPALVFPAPAPCHHPDRSLQSREWDLARWEYRLAAREDRLRDWEERLVQRSEDFREDNRLVRKSLTSWARRLERSQPALGQERASLAPPSAAYSLPMCPPRTCPFSRLTGAPSSAVLFPFCGLENTKGLG